VTVRDLDASNAPVNAAGYTAKPADYDVLVETMELKLTVDNSPTFVSMFLVLPPYLDYTTFDCLGGCAAVIANTAVVTFSMS
jgi:hypothetical protein